MFVVCWLLIGCGLFVFCLLCVVRGSWFVDCCLLFVICLLFV